MLNEKKAEVAHVAAHLTLTRSILVKLTGKRLALWFHANEPFENMQQSFKVFFVGKGNNCLKM